MKQYTSMNQKCKKESPLQPCRLILLGKGLNLLQILHFPHFDRSVVKEEFDWDSQLLNAEDFLWVF